MKRFIEGEDRTQVTLFPESLDDYVAEDNPVRVIDVFINELDLTGLGFEGVAPADTGRPAYHPAVLLQSGTPTHELQLLGGWRSSVMVERYAHLAPDRIPHRRAVDDSDGVAAAVVSPPRVANVVPADAGTPGGPRRLGSPRPAEQYCTPPYCLTPISRSGSHVAISGKAQ